ncbi:hypothetical protein F4821DRAFT_98992 [Hypoxylon rubiginosum]|uniref:Uncharacterized protein n=1 Tax=Hypoxylon rubiginosum TaxID=110542 RepID=A0ACC0D681_9PEZI|nr:hypothetical protein F4821DRAFT_98992 [Hypoxylon rubiginosum]
MKPSFETLPVELVSDIVALIDLRDIVSLRLTSRLLESKVSQQYFAKYFDHKHVELAPGPLENMVHITSQGHLGCLLQHCTITGVAESDMSGTRNDDEHVRLLTTAFSNLKQRSPKSRLASLCLDVSARNRDSTSKSDSPSLQKSIWATALRTFNVTMAALHASQLPVDEHLNIYDGVLRCSLTYEALLPLTQQFTSVPVFSSLKKLTVSLSSPLTDPEKSTSDSAISIPGQSSPTVHGKLALRALLDMSSIMPKLESLDVHWYNVIAYDTPIAPLNPAVEFGHSNFACLKTCRLRGIYISKSDLLELVKAVHPPALTMTDIRLTSGSYSSIFEYMTLPDTPITYYHLDDLRERHALVHFDVPGKAKFRYLGVTMGPSTLTRQQDEVKEAIRYRITYRRSLGSGERVRWWRSKIQEFGHQPRAR